MFTRGSVRSAIVRARTRIVEARRQQGALFWAYAVVIALGLFLRARGYFFSRHALWVDEASWAIMLMHDPLVSLLIRPMAFMGVAKLLALVFGPYEVVLRFQSFVAGTCTVFLAVPLARRLFQHPAARLLFVAVLALHPAAIDLTKEFKPYAVSLFVHLSLLFAIVTYLETQRARDLLVALGIAVMGTLWAQDAVMAYPGTFLVLGWDVFRRQRSRLTWVFAAVAAIFVLLALQYILVWRQLPADESAMWGRKYGVFYVESKRESYLQWFLSQQQDIAEFPGYRRKFWSALTDEPGLRVLRNADRLVWSLLQVIGVVALVVMRRFRHLVLFIAPFVTLAVVNYTGHWPEGPFRTNVFVLVYTTAIACTALDAVPIGGARWTHALPAAILVIAPLCLFDRLWNERKKAHSYDTEMPKALAKLKDIEPARPPENRVPLIVSRRSCDTFEYYTTVHPELRRYEQPLRARYAYECVLNLDAVGGVVSRTVRRTKHAVLLTDISSRAFEQMVREESRVRFKTVLRTNPQRVVELYPAP